jgi:hypothetical protein
MARTVLAIAVLLALAFARVSAADPFADWPVATDAELGDLRGGYIFKADGLEFRIAIGLETRVGKDLLLRTEVGAEDLSHGAAGQGGTSSDLSPVVQMAGDPTKTLVVHRVSPADLSAFVSNRVDGVTIDTVGHMDIEVPNFSQHQAAMQRGLLLQGVANQLSDAGVRSIQR